MEGVGRRRNRTISGVTTTATGTTTGTTGDATPRAAVNGLPMMAGNNGTIRDGQQQGHQCQATNGPPLIQALIETRMFFLVFNY